VRALPPRHFTKHSPPHVSKAGRKRTNRERERVSEFPIGFVRTPLPKPKMPWTRTMGGGEASRMTGAAPLRSSLSPAAATSTSAAPSAEPGAAGGAPGRRSRRHPDAAAACEMSAATAVLKT